MSSLPFDRIDVFLGGKQREYSVDEFLALSLTDRVNAILYGKISFMLAGQKVDSNRALRALRELGVGGRPPPKSS